MQIGPKSRAQLDRLALTWRQGEHVLVTGGTGSGKTVLARELDRIRLDRGGSVVVFMCKLQPDATITRDYAKSDGWVRWKRWKPKPGPHETRIILWPDVEGKTPLQAVAIMRREFARALDEIGKVGRWTVHIDEGLFVSDPKYLGLGTALGMMYALMRSARGTMITLAQRPAHLPVTIYPNITHAFVGRASEAADLKRLADLDGRTSSRELQRRISELGKHDFLWIACGSDHEPERVNLAE